MARPYVRLFSRCAALVLAALASENLAACSSDTPTVTPPLNLSLCFSLDPVGGPPESACGKNRPTCVELGRDPEQTISVDLAVPALGAWIFNVPEACDGVQGCGFAVLIVDPGAGPNKAGAFSTTAAGPSIAVPMARLANPTGTHTFRVELWNSDGSPADDTLGRQHVFEYTVDVRQSCTATDGGTSPDAAVPDSGRDGATDAAPNDGASTAKDGSLDATDAKADAARPDAGSDGAPPKPRDASAD